MFTGIIEEVGSIRAIQRNGGLVRLRIRDPQVTLQASMVTDLEQARAVLRPHPVLTRR